MDRGARWTRVHGGAESRTRLSHDAQHMWELAHLLLMGQTSMAVS